MSATVFAIVNQKGGVAKTTTTKNLGIGLARAGYKVLLVDFDPQANLTQSLDLDPTNLEEIEVSISTLMQKILDDEEIRPGEGIIHQAEGIDLIASDDDLAEMEARLINVMARERVLKRILDEQKDLYDYILIDCQPSLTILPVNALVAADQVIIPVKPAYLSVKGLEHLLTTIIKVKRQINPSLGINGILLTMCDLRTNNAKDMVDVIRSVYGKNVHIYKSFIPVSVREEETPAEGRSIYLHDPASMVALAYEAFTREIIDSTKGR